MTHHLAKHYSWWQTTSSISSQSSLTSLSRQAHLCLLMNSMKPFSGYFLLIIILSLQHYLLKSHRYHFLIFPVDLWFMISSSKTLANQSLLLPMLLDNTLHLHVNYIRAPRKTMVCPLKETKSGFPILVRSVDSNNNQAKWCHKHYNPDNITANATNVNASSNDWFPDIDASHQMTPDLSALEISEYKGPDMGTIGNGHGLHIKNTLVTLHYLLVIISFIWKMFYMCLPYNNNCCLLINLLKTINALLNLTLMSLLWSIRQIKRCSWRDQLRTEFTGFLLLH